MSTVNEYLYQTEVRLTAAFKVAGVLTDPTTVSLKVRKSGGEVETFTWAGLNITKDSTGSFHYDYLPDTTGKYFWRWDGTGAVQASAEGSFKVIRSKVIS